MPLETLTGVAMTTTRPRVRVDQKEKDMSIKTSSEAPNYNFYLGNR